MGGHTFGNDHGVKANVLTDEVAEFVRGDFAESFETGDLGFGATFLNRGETFFFAVAIASDLFVAHAEEGGLEDVEVALPDELGEELEEEGNEEEADMHAVYVRISGDDHVVVAEALEAILDVEGVLQEVEFLVFVNDFLGEAEGVEGLALEGKDRLGIDLARLGDGTRSGVALGYEKGGVEASGFLAVEVDAAIAEFFIVNLGFFSAFAGEFLNALEFLSVAFGFLNFFEKGFGGLGFTVEVIIERLLNEVRHEGAHGRSFGTHVGRAEFSLSLGFEDRFLDLDAHGGADGGADVDCVKILFVEILDGLGEGFAEGGEVGAAHGGMLPVDKGVVVFPVGIVMSEGDLDVLVLEVSDRVKGFAIEFVFKQVAETVLRFKLFAVIKEGESAVEVGVVPEHVLDVVVAETALAKDFGVGVKSQLGARVGILGGGFVTFILGSDFAAGELHGAGFAFAECLNAELGGEGVDGLDADPVEADGFFKGLGVVFRAGVDF